MLASLIHLYFFIHSSVAHRIERLTNFSFMTDGRVTDHNAINTIKNEDIDTDSVGIDSEQSSSNTNPIDIDNCNNNNSNGYSTDAEDWIECVGVDLNNYFLEFDKRHETELSFNVSYPVL